MRQILHRGQLFFIYSEHKQVGQGDDGMARTDARFRETYNRLLDFCGGLRPGDMLPSEHALAERMTVSRTVVRAGLQALVEAGIIRWEGRLKELIRRPGARDRLEQRDEAVTLDQLETRFLDWVLRFDVPADTALNVTRLARQFSVTPHMLQEFLSSLSRFGLVERRPRGGWILRGFTAGYAIELSEFRLVLEMNAIRVLLRLEEAHPVWARLEDLRARHLALLARIETDYHDFSRLDEAFHSAVNSVVQNRFVAEFQKVITLIFHYHYQWDKTEERQRNETAIHEHMALIDALRRRDAAGAEAAALTHLRTSQGTLLSSLRGNNLA